MDNNYVYLAPLPPCVNEAVLPCADGYTIYLSDRLTREARLDAYNHALGHIARGEFYAGDVQSIETYAHSILR